MRVRVREKEIEFWVDLSENNLLFDKKCDSYQWFEKSATKSEKYIKIV